MQRKSLFVVFLSFFLIFCFSSLVTTHPVDQKKSTTVDLKKSIPVDPEVTVGKFDNGLTYYIKVNKKPEKRAQLWLAVNAGSVLEDDDQQGLAHLAEHMAFNGTKNFKKQELIDYLESIGMKFGPEVNAYTSFDETVYMLQVPTDSAHIVEKGFQILEDWAHLVSYDEEEIDKERGVVIEEWRLGRGADMRMLDKQLPILFKGSRYANRLPIGKKEVVDTCKYVTLKRYYNEWYRPDLMAVVAVGDFDPEWIMGLIKKHFASITPIKEPRKRQIYPVPDHKETLFAIATDPEASRTVVAVYFKSEPEPEESIGDFRRILMQRLYNEMINNRIDELRQQADPPILYGYSGKGRFVRSKGVYFLAAMVKEDGIERGLDALLTESVRVKKFGFTQSELDRTKKSILRNMEREYKERDKTNSRVYAQRCTYHFLEADPMPGIGNEIELARALLPDIKLDEVNELIFKWLTDENRVILVNAPDKEEVKVPSEQELLAVFKNVEQKEILAYEDKVSEAPLVENVPEAAKIVNEKKIEELGVTEWTLANGVRVVLKPTDFKNDEIRFYAYSLGGNSLSTDADFMSSSYATQIIRESGIGAFNQIELNKKLTGKVVNIYPYIGTLTEGVSGNASPEDIETLFELIYLYMTSPRMDQETFQSYITRMKGIIENRSARPETALSDTLSVTLAQYHHRARPLTVKLLDEVDLDKAFKFYQDRFADASDFYFFFVGNFDLEEIKPLVKTYLGGLPSLNRNEMWKDPGVTPPKGVIKKTVRKGIEPKSYVRIVFTGPYEWSRENNYAFSSMIDVMRIKLRETLREDLSGTYGVGVWSSTDLYPQQEYTIQINFGCNPERVEELSQTVFDQIDSLQTYGTNEKYITKVRETQTRSYETDLKENGYWVNELRSHYYTKQDPLNILGYPKLVETLSAKMVQDAAKKYFNTENYVQVVLLPE